MVVLNSRGGYLSDGLKLGDYLLSTKYILILDIEILVPSSCSTAFLGGKYRTMEKTATLMVHSPYFIEAEIQLSANLELGQIT